MPNPFIRSVARKLGKGVPVENSVLTRAAYALERKMGRILGAGGAPGGTKVSRAYHATYPDYVPKIEASGEIRGFQNEAFFGGLQKSASGSYGTHVYGLKDVAQMTAPQRRSFVETFGNLRSLSQETNARIGRLLPDRPGEINTVNRAVHRDLLDYLGESGAAGFNPLATSGGRLWGQRYAAKLANPSRIQGFKQGGMGHGVETGFGSPWDPTSIFRLVADVEILGLPDQPSIYGPGGPMPGGGARVPYQISAVAMKQTGMARPFQYAARSLEELPQFEYAKYQSLQGLGGVGRTGLHPEAIAYIASTRPHETHGAQFIKEFISPYKAEAAKYGVPFVGSEREVMKSVVGGLERGLARPAAGRELLGWNILTADVPWLREAAARAGPDWLGRFETALGGYKQVDVRSQFVSLLEREYEKRGVDIYGTFKRGMVPGTSLGVAANIMGVTPGGTLHGPFVDVSTTEKIYAAMQRGEVPEDIVRRHLGQVAETGTKKSSSLAKGLLTRLGAQAPAPRARGAISAAAVSPTAQADAAGGMISKVREAFPSKLSGHTDQLLKNIFKNKGFRVAGAVAVGLGVASALSGDVSLGDRAKMVASNITNPVAPRREFITSSTLGITSPDQLYQRVVDPAVRERQTDVAFRRNRGTIEAGTAIHDMIARQLVASGAATDAEVYLEDPQNKVFGAVDVMLQGGIPLEIKTVGDKAFSKLTGPRPKDVSQANFYAIASGAQRAAIMYVSRGQPAQRKMFNISADYGMYGQDISRIRQFQSMYGDITSGTPNLSRYRPSILNRMGVGVNPNIPTFPSSVNPIRHHIRSQRSTLPILPQYNRGMTTVNHANAYGSRAERMA